MYHCVKPAGVQLPDKETFYTMWRNNPHGAGFMTAGYMQTTQTVFPLHKVIVRKGFMDFDSFYNAVCEKVRTDFPAVLHFRISTQAGVNPQMTQPFVSTQEKARTLKTNDNGRIGICHNGIIPLTTVKTEKTYSDTALFITDYIGKHLTSFDSIHDKKLLRFIQEAGGHSRFVLLNGLGEYELIGNGWVRDNGLIYSNSSFIPPKPVNLFSDSGWRWLTDGVW